MNKTTAIKLLGGEPSLVAKAIGISEQAISKWPDVLSPKIADRVEAAYHRLNGVALPVVAGVNHG
jgi:hypothetical protein